MICAAEMDPDNFPQNMDVETSESGWIFDSRNQYTENSKINHTYKKHLGMEIDYGRTRSYIVVGGIYVSMDDIIDTAPQIYALKFDLTGIIKPVADLYKFMPGETGDTIQSYHRGEMQIIEFGSDAFEFLIGLINTAEYECAICGGVYDSSPPSYEMCVEHIKVCCKFKSGCPEATISKPSEIKQCFAYMHVRDG